MALVSFERCVHAIAETMARQNSLPATSAGTVTAVTAFLVTTHAHMPDYMRLGLWMLVLAFDAWPYPTSGKPFHHLDVERRSLQIANWEQSRMGFRRSFIAFFRALVTFGLATERDRDGR